MSTTMNLGQKYETNEHHHEHRTKRPDTLTLVTMNIR